MTITDDELKEINKELLLTFGYESSIMPRYQVSWTTGLTEMRLGTFCKFDEHGNQIAEKTEFKECLKYPLAQNRYVLERLFYFESDELPYAKTLGSYEAIYYFEDSDHKPIPCTKDAVLAICRILEAPKQKRTPSDLEDERVRAEKAQIEKDYLYLEEVGRSALFYDNAGTFIDSTKVKEE
jgi:hypothetical protein